MNIKRIVTLSKWYLAALWIALSALPVLAQCGSSSTWSPATPSVVHPEGTAPAYLGSVFLLYPAQPTPISAGIQVQYHWVGDSGTDLHLPIYGGTGPVPYDASKGGNPYTFDFAGNAITSFSSASTVTVEDQSNCYLYTSTTPAPYVLGLTKVVVTDTAGNELPPSSVTLVWHSSNYAISRSYAYAAGGVTFGQGLHNAGTYPYPPGLSNQTFSCWVSVAGRYPVHSAYLTPTGLNNKVLTLVCPTYNENEPGPPTAGTDSATTLDPAPAAGTTGGSSGGVLDLSWLQSFVSGFFASLRDLLVELFTPSPSDITALTAAKDQIFNWGPFGVYAEVKAQFAIASTGNGKGSSDPTYWYFPLRIAEFTSNPSPASPVGYDGSVPVGGGGMSPNLQRTMRANSQIAYRAQEGNGTIRPGYYVPQIMGANGKMKAASAVSTPTTVLDINLWSHLWPDHWDLSPYSVGLVVMRSLEWAGAWIFWGLALRKRFTPEIRI